ncbi:MAG: heterodisulfide reductase [Dehalococcoidia bacterium]|nr:heterodisulfide reductase [Dehalococcoidia bacterium]MSQ34362.1 heterodisulfide reductase [Dehalococcoidia bacterium]
MPHKYAFYPGCVARGGTPELYDSAIAVTQRLGIELVELTKASCTGAGVLQEKNLKLGDTLNVRTFAMAEQLGLPILVLCSTCQGVMSQANARVQKDPEYLKEINSFLKEEGLEYKGTTVIKHLLWVLIEDIGLDTLKATFTRELSGLNVAPFYGCYIVRPSDVLGFGQNPQRQTSLETVIAATGAKPVDFPGKTKCCGLPILYINQENALKMVADHTGTAQSLGADAMVTPCPLCHLNLDGYQPKARKKFGSQYSGASGQGVGSERTEPVKVPRSDKDTLPILHLPQLIGLAMGMDHKALGLQRHIVPTESIVKKAESKPAPAGVR